MLDVITTRTSRGLGGNMTSLAKFSLGVGEGGFLSSQMNPSEKVKSWKCLRLSRSSFDGYAYLATLIFFPSLWYASYIKLIYASHLPATKNSSVINYPYPNQQRSKGPSVLNKALKLLSTHAVYLWPLGVHVATYLYCYLWDKFSSIKSLIESLSRNIALDSRAWKVYVQSLTLLMERQCWLHQALCHTLWCRRPHGGDQHVLSLSVLCPVLCEDPSFLLYRHLSPWHVCQILVLLWE